MIFSQHYLDCLSHASYLVGDETSGRAVVVDPRRDVDAYLAEADAAGLRIEHVIETHLHADFVSGHLELAARSGADICYGEAAEVDFPVRRLGDGERISLGEVQLEVRATPGHTPESISVVVWARPDDEVPYGVLTGDTLFIGDVGRPDLLAAPGAASPEAMARQLFRSLRDKLLPLPDATRVFPAHGAGSSCGKSLSTDTWSTLGDQRRTNHALAPMDEDAFVALVTEGQPATPPYFSFDARRNREARPLLEEHDTPPPLGLDRVLGLQAGGAVVIDTRQPAAFATGHLRGSLNVGLEGRFAEYAGDVVRPDQPVVLVGEPGTELEARVRLARIGFDEVVGHLAAPLEAFAGRPEVVDRASRLTVAELEERMGAVGDLVVLDVRGPGEVALGSVPGAVNLPLARLVAGLGSLDPARPTVVYCTGGYRSSIAASALRAAGFADVSDLLGGWQAWQAGRAGLTGRGPGGS